MHFVRMMFNIGSMLLNIPHIPMPVRGVFLVGGALRDLLLSRTPADYDLVVFEAGPAGFAKTLAEKTGGRYVHLGQNKTGIHRVITDAGTYDVSSPTGHTIEKDLQNRDFTINAIALDLYTGKIIDVVNGIDAIGTKTISVVSPAAFQKDPVRLLRAFRMAGDLGFDIKPDTMALISLHAGLITNAAPERIREEWMKFLFNPQVHHLLTHMAGTGLLFEIFPELAHLTGCFQNHHHDYDVMAHTFSAFRHLEDIFCTPDDYLGLYFQEAVAAWQAHTKALLKHALLLHDAGKPGTRTVDTHGRVHFHGHAALGADISEKVSDRLRFSKQDKTKVSTLIRYHIRPLNLFLLHQSKQLKNRHCIRFFMQAGGMVPGVLVHSMADHLGKKQSPSKDHIPFAASLGEQYYDRFQKAAGRKRLLTGQDLINVFDLPQSPLFGIILRAIEERTLAGEISTRKQALMLVKKWIDSDCLPVPTTDQHQEIPPPDSNS